ncbi:hypothetical protein BJ742DRAFT_819507 [Cladochytrium replicatum]|nr:hypothetical protein BJ742DRAFT_819507 [Cladochytrium replicatum]
MVEVSVTLTAALILWRVLGTLATFAVGKILVSYLFSAAPRTATAAEYDLLNRIGGSDSAAWSLIPYVLAKSSSKTEGQKQSKESRFTLSVRLILVSLALFSPLVLSLLFDFGLSDFSSCKNSVPETLQPSFQQLRAAGLCGPPLNCDPLLATKGKILQCNNVVNLTFSGRWVPSCSDDPFPVFSPAPTNATGYWGTSGSAEILPSAIVYNGIENKYINSANISTKSGNTTVREIFASISTSEIESGDVRKGLAWYQSGQGVADAVVGVPTDPRIWKTDSITRTVYRSSVGCAWTGLYTFSVGPFSYLRLQKTWNETAMNYSGPPELRQILYNTTVSLRKDFLKAKNWTDSPTIPDYFELENKRLNQADSSIAEVRPVSGPRLITNAWGIRNGTNFTAGFFGQSVIAACYADESVQDVLVSRYCIPVLLQRTELMFDRQNGNIQYNREHQYICAFRLAVGRQKGVLSRQSDTTHWQTEETIPTNMTIRQFYGLSLLRNASNPANVRSWSLGQFQTSFELTPAVNAADVPEYSSSIKAGDFDADLRFKARISKWHGLGQSLGLFGDTEELQEYMPPGSDFLEYIIGRTISRYQRSGGGVSTSQQPWFTQQSNATEALVTVLVSSVASVFVQSVSIAPWREDLLALAVKVEGFDATCWNPRVGLAALVFVAAMLVLVLVVLVSSFTRARVNQNDLVGLVPYMDALASRYRGERSRARSLWGWLDQHGTVVLEVQDNGLKGLRLAVAPPPGNPVTPPNAAGLPFMDLQKS